MRKIHNFFCFMLMLLAVGQLSATNDWSFTNTGTNATFFVTGVNHPANPLQISGDSEAIDSIGVFYENADGSLSCAGASAFDPNGSFQITVWQDEFSMLTQSFLGNGAPSGGAITILAKDASGAEYEVEATQTSGALVETNNSPIWFVSSLNFAFTLKLPI